MSTTQARHSSFSVSIASGDALDVRDFTVEEGISALFSVTLTAVAESPDLDFEAIIGRPARFEVQAGLAGIVRARVWSGICRHVKEIAVAGDGLATYRLEIVPALWLAGQRRNHRMFQLLSDVDIVLELLAEWGIDPVRKLSGTYRKRKYRVQYGESDYAFMCRLLEDAGVSFHFSDDSGESRLVLSDAPETGDLRDPKIPFRDEPGDADLEHVTAVSAERQVKPGRYTMRDHDYRRPPSYRLMASAAAEPAVEQQLERFHYTPGAFLFESDQGDATPAADDRGRYRTDEAEGAAIAQRRLDAQRSEAFSCTFESNAVDLAPGVVFAILQHPRRDLGEDRRLLAVRTRLRGEVGRSWKLEGEARSAAVPYRPPLATPKPRTNGVESATVVGPPGEEIHTDEFGRVRVHFHWDRESRMDQHSSCWIHVSQPWGGTGYGGLNLPRIGQEVLVDFLGGDPDRPVIIGRVYTSLQRVPYSLPQHKTQSGWRSNSTNATGGYNEIMFEDSAGQELVRMQAEKDMHKLVKNDEEHTVGRDRTRNVGETERVTVGQNQSITVGVNRTAQIGNDTTIVTNQHLVMISPPGEGPADGSSSITMTDKKIVMDTGAGATITMDKDKITIEADDLVEIRGKKRGVNLHAPAPGGKANVFTGDSFTVDCKKVSITASDQLKIVGKDVSIIGTDTAHLAGGSEVTIDGGNVEVAGTSKTAISGGVVWINGPGQPAGRVGDAVGGTILSGSSTVLIGGKGTAPAKPSSVEAKATKKPTPEQRAEIQKALDSGDRQRAIDLTVKYYGIDQSNVPGGAKYVDKLNDKYADTPFDGSQRIGPPACSSPETLATTLVHETTHSNQAAALRSQDPSLTDWPGGETSRAYDDAQAYKSELDSAHNTGLDGNPSEYNHTAERYTKYKNDLPPDQQDKLIQGKYPR